jgi:hypothetical protein
LTVSEFLSKPSDRQMRGIISFTQPNEKLMPLWGVRFVITDHLLDFGTQRLEMPVKVTDPAHYKSPIRLYELAEPNLGNYSPTEVVVAKDAKETLARMKAPGFDGRRSVVTTADLPGELLPARGASMALIEGGLALSAASDGVSILVLPVQFSHCWVPVAGSKVTLFRANLMQLGVRFSGQLSAQIQYRFGPFWNSSCRREDGKDAERLKMVEARNVPARSCQSPSDC